MALLSRTRSRSVGDVEQQLRAELENLQSLLGLDRCAIELVSFEQSNGAAVLRADASCTECDASGATFLPGIETRLKLRVAELMSVRIQRDGEK